MRPWRNIRTWAASVMRGRNWALALAGCALSFLVALTAAAQTPNYTYTWIDVGLPFGINNLGQIVGISESHGFLLNSDGSLITIDFPGALSTVSYGINNAGQIVGGFQDSTGAHGFLYSGGSFTTIDVPGATTGTTVAFGINDASEVVGSFYDGAGSHGFLYSGGSFTAIDVPGLAVAFGINDVGQIVGSTSSGSHSFLLNTDGTFTQIDAPDAFITVAQGINTIGQIVGWFYDGGVGYTDFLYSGGSFITLIGEQANSINDVGQIVGFSFGRGFLANPVSTSTGRQSERRLIMKKNR
jgi:probable HAF family extracellular repeat protein